MRSARLRLLDLTIVALTAPAWASVMAFCGALVRLTSGSPVFFEQARVGLEGRHFDVLKFRSMPLGDNPLIPDESRTTQAGRFLRKWSLDELPQIVNVIRGDMSLVGPRPMLPDQDRILPPEALGRRRVKPGITGLAQVNGRNSITWSERLVYDLEWAADPAPSRYLATLGRTVRVVLTRDGVAGHDPTDPFVVDLDSTDLTKTIAEPQESHRAA